MGRSGLDLYLVSGWQCVNSSLKWMPFWNGCLSNQRLSHTFTSQKRKVTIRVYITTCLGQCEASKHNANIKPLKPSECWASLLDDKDRPLACPLPLADYNHTHTLLSWDQTTELTSSQQRGHEYTHQRPTEGPPKWPSPSCQSHQILKWFITQQKVSIYG